jgi:hypothetical protein
MLSGVGDGSQGSIAAHLENPRYAGLLRYQRTQGVSGFPHGAMALIQVSDNQTGMPLVLTLEQGIRAVTVQHGPPPEETESL